MFRKLYYNLSPLGRRIVRRVFYFPYDFVALFRDKSNLVPAKGKANIGRGDFVKTGDKFFNDICKHSNIQPDFKILDIGVGLGRIARPFTNYLNNKGIYTGFDILQNDVEWCKKKYSQFPQFNFDHFAIRNDLYLPNGKIDAQEFTFPYPENYYNLVIAISVFTHIQTPALENYLKQIKLVLKPTGVCYASFFLTDISQKYSLFPIEYDKYCLHNSKLKNANVAYRSDYLYELVASLGFEILSIKKGWWKTGSPINEFDFQDIIILKNI